MPRKAKETFAIGHWSLQKQKRSPYWNAVQYHPETRERTQRSLGVTDFADAKRKLTHLAANTPDPVEKGAEFTLIVQALEYYYDNKVSPIGEGAKILPSAPSVKSTIGIWKAHFKKNTRIDDLTPARLEKFYEALRKQGKSLGYISRIVRVGSTAFQYACDNKKLRDVPKIKDPQEQTDKDDVEPLGRPLAIEELATLIVNQEQDHMLMFIWIMLNTACRPEAAFDLKRSAVCFDTVGRVQLNPEGRRQTKKFRPLLPLTKTLRSLLVNYEKLEKDAGREVDYYITYKSEPVKSVRTAWRNMVERAGFVAVDENGKETRDCVTPYSIRHTIGRVLRAAKVPSEDRSIFMGHKRQGSSRVTSIYSPDEPEYLLEAAQAIDAYMNRLRDEITKQRKELAAQAGIAKSIAKNAQNQSFLVKNGHPGLETAEA